MKHLQIKNNFIQGFPRALKFRAAFPPTRTATVSCWTWGRGGVYWGSGCGTTETRPATTSLTNNKNTLFKEKIHMVLANLTRGTLRFLVRLSNDLQTWEDVLDKGLALPAGTDSCGSLKMFELDVRRWARYVRFQDLQHYQKGPALAYFGILEGCEFGTTEQNYHVEINSRFFLSEVGCVTRDATLADSHLMETREDVEDEIACLDVCKVRDFEMQHNESTQI